MPSGRNARPMSGSGRDPRTKRGIGRVNNPLVFRKRGPHIHGHANIGEKTYTVTTDLQGGEGDRIHMKFDKNGNLIPDSDH